jgi:hypothetical protein
VIASAVHDHVRALEHVTRHALRRLGARFVEVVLRSVVRDRRVTPGAQRVPGLAQAPAVRLVTARARHAGLVHLALEKRSVLVDLIEDLPVGVVEALVEERHAVRLPERLAVLIVAPHRRAA